MCWTHSARTPACLSNTTATTQSRICDPLDSFEINTVDSIYESMRIEECTQISFMGLDGRFVTTVGILTVTMLDERFAIWRYTHIDCTDVVSAFPLHALV